MLTLSSKLIDYYLHLRIPPKLPEGVEVLYPQKDAVVMKIVIKFFEKFFNDHKPRTLLIGINPGRFGGGITGLNFTAPRQLGINCQVDHPFGNSSELSAEFIYEVIESYGGAARFYGDFFLSAMSPLGFTRNGLNLNYYDDKALQEALTPFIVKNITTLLGMGFKKDRCICIGGEKNFKFLMKLNQEHQFFNKIIPVPHPRFILQYRRKQKDLFIRQYLDALQD